MQTEITITNVVIRLKKPFEKFVTKLENVLGRLEVSAFTEINSNPIGVREKINSMRGIQGLMIFNVNNHGQFLQLRGIYRKVKLYEIGNPLGSTTATSIDLQTALYIPLRLLIYESNDGNAFASYHLPSTLLRQFNNGKIEDFALQLDKEMKEIISYTDIYTGMDIY